MLTKIRVLMGLPIWSGSCLRGQGGPKDDAAGLDVLLPAPPGVLTFGEGHRERKNVEQGETVSANKMIYSINAFPRFT